MAERSVLVTRPEPGAAGTADRLWQMGFRPVVAPLLRVRPTRIALPPASTLQAVIASSGNAVVLPQAYRDLKLLAVGTSTAQRALAAGFTTVLDADGDAAALAALAARELNPAAGPLLLATGRGEGDFLAAALRASGFVVHRRAVYAATAVSVFPLVAETAMQAGLDAALFFSAATGQAFAGLLPPPLRSLLDRTVAIGISPSAIETVRHLPWRDVRVAVRPTQDGVLAQL